MSRLILRALLLLLPLVSRTSFHDYYRRLFGERWEKLREALSRSGTGGLYPNPFASTPQALPGEPLEGLDGFRWSAEPFPRPGRDEAGLLHWYAMDAASVVAARSLGVRAGQRVLDMCAAPGGKSCVLAASLAEAGELVANDRSASRRARLDRVLRDYLPPPVRKRVRVTGHDASRWGLFEREAYDRVLLDAPCSSERHVLADPRALRQWSPARTKGLARRQYALLAAALDAVKVGGRILYSTCALLPAENDELIERLLGDRKRVGRVRVLPLEAPFGEPTEHGWAMLPDRTGWGPIGMSLLERLA